MRYTKGILLLSCLLLILGGCKKKKTDTEILLNPSGWTFTGITLVDTIKTTTTEISTNKVKEKYQTLTMDFNAGKVRQVVGQLTFDAADFAGTLNGLDQAKNFENAGTVKFSDDGTFEITLSRQLKTDSTYTKIAGQSYAFGRAYSQAANLEKLKGNWQWGYNGDNYSILYLKQKDFFSFILGDNFAATYFPNYEVPLVVKTLEDGKIDLEFVNALTQTTNSNPLESKVSVFSGVNKISMK
jgi:hypothetical protein